MKQGKTLQELAAEILRQGESRRDFVADTRYTRMTPERGLELENGDRDLSFAISPVAHNQIAQRLEIPKRFTGDLDLSGGSVERVRDDDAAPNESRTDDQRGQGITW